MSDYPFNLEREILIVAPRELVFSFFTQNDRFAEWWGKGSTIEPRPGGEVFICYPGNVVARGKVQELHAPDRIAFTYGYEDPKKPIAVGGSLVTVTLQETGEGTRVKLRHDLKDAATRDEHVQGWRYQMSVFSNVTTRLQHAGVTAVVDRYFQAWNTADENARVELLKQSVTPEVSYRDQFGVLSGLDDLSAQIAATAKFMPLKLERDGDAKQTQGSVLVRWQAKDREGAPKAKGLTAMDLAPDGKIRKGVGFWE